jgi:lincosamide nucleotidyltransferase A/C/D/E
MTAQRALEIVGALRASGDPVWIDGGWGVDALCGFQSRDHNDLDLVVLLSKVDSVLEILTQLGFRVQLDERPTRVVVTTPSGEQVDLHPVEFDATGDAWQRGAGAGGGDALYPADGFTEGLIGGRTVPCLSARLQVRHHRGYEPKEKDRRDLLLLFKCFGAD